MSDLEVMPELKEIVGALLFVAKTPITAGDMVRVMKLVAENWGGPTKDFAKVKEEDVKAALDQIRADLAEKKTGITIAEVAHGFRFENEVTCGPWVRQLLEKGRPTRLSRPALETLAIIAYRQPGKYQSWAGPAAIVWDMRGHTCEWQCPLCPDQAQRERKTSLYLGSSE